MKQIKVTDLSTGQPLYFDLEKSNEIAPVGTGEYSIHTGSEQHLVSAQDAARVIQMREAISIPVPVNQPPVHYPPGAATTTPPPPAK